ncbi:YqgE/AlgH family protein [Polycyclovorans algicola]|uniref:YqgE/AlgH family protein n=1 Tax=Polycyclovorans algicola TaxID=616992 RepID=UPI0004A74817|nr:YqgE/AlgH family protein [Polycyclovorans algicola]
MSEFFKNQFLIAMPAMLDEHFSRTVSLLCEHNDHGAIGLVINRPMELKLVDVLKQMDLESDALDEDAPVFWGGPVQPERGFVIHDAPGGWESTLDLPGGLHITTSRDVLRALGTGTGPKNYVVALGFAGWDEGQLEEEVLSNAWLNTPVDQQILFQTPIEERWQAATRLLGVDITQLTQSAGHA